MTPESRAALLNRGRAAALTHMTGRVRVLRSAGLAPLDPETGRQRPQYWVVYSDLPFRVRGARAGASTSRSEQVGESDLQIAIRDGVMPHHTVVYARDLIVVDQGEAAGSVWEVVDGDSADGQTSLRVPIISTRLDPDWQEADA